MGIEPTCPAWKAGVLPLNYTRKKYSNCQQMYKSIYQQLGYYHISFHNARPNLKFRILACVLYIWIAYIKRRCAFDAAVAGIIPMFAMVPRSAFAAVDEP